MNKCIIAFVLLLITCSLAQAQSLHYTYWDHAPLSINPALAGGYEGTIRVSGIHRSQYGFRTLADVGVEYNLPFRPRKRDWITGGLSLARDVAGDLNYGYNLLRLGAAYHLALNKDATSDLALGIQMVGGSLSANLEGVNTPRQLAGLDDPDVRMLISGGMQAQNPGQTEGNFTDYRAGLVYSSTTQKGKIQFGVQAANLFGPTASQSGSRNDRLDIRIGGFFLMDRNISNNLSILPAVLAQFQGPASEIQVRTMMGYDLKKEYGLRLKAGVGYRVGDAGQLLVGADYKDWMFGLAFDLTTSSLNEVNNGAGAIEVSAIKQFNIRKKPDVKPVIFCPRI